MQKELSFMDAAVSILQKDKKPFDLYQLFDRIALDLGVSEEDKLDLVTKFYTDLTTSAKFVYVGDNKWNLKANEKIELWEKDGSFYKEYTVVELPDEYKQELFPTPKKHKPVVAKPVVEEPIDVLEPVVEAKPEPEVVVEEVVKPVVTAPVVDEVEDTEEYEEVFEDYEDFDEEKYNEYMDTYEDQYED